MRATFMQYEIEMATQPTTPRAATNVRVHLCIPDDQERHLPKRRRAPQFVPPDVPMPRVGEVIYLSSTSAWMVSRLIHEWTSAVDLRIEIWLEWVGSARHSRPPGFAMTQ